MLTGIAARLILKLGVLLDRILGLFSAGRKFSGVALKPDYNQATLTGTEWPANTQIVLWVRFERISNPIPPSHGVALERVFAVTQTDATGQFSATATFNLYVVSQERRLHVNSPLFSATDGRVWRHMKLPPVPLVG